MYNVEDLKRLLSLEQYRVITDDGKILPPSHSVFKDISEAMLELGSSMTPKHIYTSVQNNRHGFYTHVRITFMPNTEDADASYNITSGDTNDESFDVPFSLPKSSVTEKFNIVVSSEKWAKIKPSRKKRGKPSRLKIHRWTNLVADKIYEQHKITCAFSFKSAKVSESTSAKYYVKFIGKCKECGADVEGVALKKPKHKQDAIFTCKLTNYQSNFTHTKRRQLRGDRRKVIASELVDHRMAASLWRNKEANDNMTFGGDIPPTLPNADVLRKAKQEEIDNRLGLTSTDALRNLQIAKHTTHFSSIHAIGLDPFFCIYWLPEQSLLHKACYRSKTKVYDSVDATGGVAFRITLPVENFKSTRKTVNKKSPYIFLYQYMCICGNDPDTAQKLPVSCPVYQMVSARHDASFLTFFFTEIVRSGAPKPTIMVTDFGKALLIGVARAFANCADLKHYMSVCYEHIVLHKVVKLPDCCLRLDVNHFIAQVARWRCLKGQKSKVRQFYLRALGHVYLMTDFCDIEMALRSILIVALSEHIGTKEEGTQYLSTSYLNHVDNIIKGTPNFPESTEEKEESESESEDEEKESNEIESILYSEDSAASTWIDWANSLYQEAVKIAIQTEDENVYNLNPFNIPNVAKMLKDLMYYLPLWTAIMYPTFQVDISIRSSSAVEGQFSKVKTFGFDQLPLRVDKLVLKHLNWLEGEVKLLAPSMLDAETRKKGSLNKRKKSEDSFNEKENWRGKSQKEKAAKLNHESSCSYIDDLSVGSCNFQTDDSFKLEEIFNSTSVSDDTDQMNTNNLTFCKVEERSSGTQQQEVHTASPKKAFASNNNYLSDFGDWDSGRGFNTVTLPLLPNGLLSPEIKIKNVKYLVTNTCAFDSLITLIMQAALQSEDFKNEIHSADLPIGNLALKIIKNGKYEKMDFKTRFDILYAINFLKKGIETRRLLSLDANCNVAHLYEHLFQKCPFYTTISSCGRCESKIVKRLNYIPINTHIVFENGYEFLQDAMDDVNKDRQNNSLCKKCKAPVSVRTEFSSYLVMDLSISTCTLYKEVFPENRRKSCTLGAVTKSLTLNNQEYSLIGLVHYTFFSIHSGHYRSFVFNGEYWREYDDLSSKPKNVPSHTEVLPHIIMYVKQSCK